jgi:Holliday junction resolvasome RuvABC ATP-dependent DNA helicase subunit
VVDRNEFTLKPRPSVAPNFVGREDILEAMRQRHFAKRSGKTRMPAITVLSGLGGSGKTQIALKFADEFEAKFVHVIHCLEQR